MQVLGWRSVFILKNSLTPLSLRAIISSSSSSSRFAYFHSSPIASEKKKDKSNHVSWFFSLSTFNIFVLLFFFITYSNDLATVSERKRVTPKRGQKGCPQE